MEYKDLLIETANNMVKKGKGILAADESNPTCGKRFESIGVESSFENRNEYRDMLFSTKDLENFIFWISELLNINIKIISQETLLSPDSNLDLSLFEKIRWIATSQEIPTQIFNSGATVDERGLSQNGKQELLCWVKEQSISITNHRYGNIGSGPQPFKDW